MTEFQEISKAEFAVLIMNQSRTWHSCLSSLTSMLIVWQCSSTQIA